MFRFFHSLEYRYRYTRRPCSNAHAFHPHMQREESCVNASEMTLKINFCSYVTFRKYKYA